MRKRIGATIGAILLAVGACTSSGTSAPPERPPPVAHEAMNPLDTLKRAGAVPEPGAKFGEHGLLAEGERYATGHLGKGDAVEIVARTYPSNDARDQAFASGTFVTDDSHTVLAGDRFLITLTFQPHWNGTDYVPADAKLRQSSAETVANRVHGQVI